MRVQRILPLFCFLTLALVVQHVLPQWFGGHRRVSVYLPGDVAGAPAGDSAEVRVRITNITFQGDDVWEAIWNDPDQLAADPLLHRFNEVLLGTAVAPSSQGGSLALLLDVNAFELSQAHGASGKPSPIESGISSKV